MSCALAAILFVLGPGDPQETEETLLREWESVQKRDPRVEKFEKTHERVYRFKTSRFPFDGELKVLNVVLDPTTYRQEYGVSTGIVEIELVGWPEEMQRKYYQSHRSWCELNSFVFDPTRSHWVLWRDFRWSPLSQNSFWREWLVPVVGLGILLIVVYWSALITRKQRLYMQAAIESMNQSIALQKKGIEIGESSNKLLLEIRDAMKTPR